ncbi:MAG: hypothetical protein WCH43_16000, partial [Verrucomicrobiota bacterium]
SRTSSSLNGLMMAMMNFIHAPFATLSPGNPPACIAMQRACQTHIPSDPTIHRQGISKKGSGMRSNLGHESHNAQFLGNCSGAGSPKTAFEGLASATRRGA